MAFASNLKMRCACQMNLNYEGNELHNAVTQKPLNSVHLIHACMLARKSDSLQKKPAEAFLS